MRKSIALLFLLAWALPLPGLRAEQGDGKAEDVFRTGVVERGPLAVTLTATGTLEPEEVIDVGAQVAGTIVAFGPDPRDASKTVDYGTPVEKGTVLAKIDGALYATQVERARADLVRAKADLEAREALLLGPQHDWQRAQQLQPQKAISQEDLDRARAAYEVARANVAVGRAAVQQAEAALQQARVNLGYCTIASPVKGVVIDRRVNVGQTVVASLNAPSLFLIARDLKRMQVWASVNEADVGQVHPGQPVRFTVDAFPGRKFEGVVAPDQPRLNATLTQNVVTYTVVVNTDNSSGKLLPYLTANLEIEVSRRDNALLVPNAALRWQPSPDQVVPDARKDYLASLKRRPGSGGPEREAPQHGRVWVPDGKFVRPVPLRVGLSDGVLTEIVSGDLKEGQAVVIGVREAPPRESGRRPAGTNPFTFPPSDILLVQPGTGASGGPAFGTVEVSRLTASDTEALARECPAVVDAAPLIRVRAWAAYQGRRWVPMYVFGTSSSYLRVRGWQDLAEGEPFTDRDVRTSARVCLLGQTLARELFGKESPLGKIVRLGDVPLKVLGVLAPKGRNELGMDQDDILLAPWKTLKPQAGEPSQRKDADSGTTPLDTLSRLYPSSPEAQPASPPSPRPDTVDQILVRARSAKEAPEARRQITELLLQRHHVAPGQEADFYIRDLPSLTLDRPSRRPE